MADSNERYDLKKLKQVASDACKKACAQHQDFGSDPVNWADFDCTAAYFQIDDEGDESYMVTLEEASPGCRLVLQFVARELEAAGFVDVNIETEW